MAVITRFIVVRNGVELKAFDVKKSAEAYDHMLDAAEKLAAFIKQGDLPIDLDEKTIDEISIHLAKNAPEVVGILKGVKPLVPAVASTKPAEPVKSEAPKAPEPTKKKSVTEQVPASSEKKKRGEKPKAATKKTNKRR